MNDPPSFIRFDSDTLYNKTLPMILDEWVTTILHNESTVLERRIRLLVKPKPWYITERLWLRLVAKFIVIEQRDKSL